MLTHLYLRNIVLIPEATLFFQEGFHILTGESGAGKSVIISSLNQLLKERGDNSLIRSGADEAVIEATIKSPLSEHLISHLQEHGVLGPFTEEFALKKILSTKKTTRTFINNQPVHQNLLRWMGEKCLQIISQNAKEELFKPKEQLHILDTYGELQSERSKYKELFEAIKELEETLTSLNASDKECQKDIERAKTTIEEISLFPLNSFLEKSLEEESVKLFHAEELKKSLEEVQVKLNTGDMALLKRLHQIKTTLSHTAEIDSRLQEVVDLTTSAYIQLQEVFYTIERTRSSITPCPERLEEVNSQLKHIQYLKKHYGATIDEILDTQKSCGKIIASYSSLDEKREALTKAIEEKRKMLAEVSSHLSSLRKKHADTLSQKVEKILHAMHMSEAKFCIKVSPSTPSVSGEDHIEFLCQANKTKIQQMIPIKEHASGGEMSRIFLAIKCVLAEKEAAMTLIFDEIDANIGGKTATTIGKYLKELSRVHQVLCITHFPQVATLSDVHHLVEKSLCHGETITKVSTLTKADIPKELDRMSGK